MRFTIIKSFVKAFWIWRNKEGLKMERNKRNRIIRHAIFRDSNLNRISNVLLNRTRLFPVLLQQIQHTKKLFFPFLNPLFYYIFGRFVKTKCRYFSRMSMVEKESLNFFTRFIVIYDYYKGMLLPHRSSSRANF